MKIAINTTAFRPGRMGGMETYLRNLLLALQEADHENHYAVLCDRHNMQELPLTRPNFQMVPCNFTQPSLGWLLRGVIRNATRIDILRPVMNRYAVDVIHHPFSFLNPLNVATPSVLTFQDMQFEFFPEYFSRYELKVLTEFYRPSAEQATRIIAISGHVKACLVEKYGIDPGKIDVIHIGYNPAYRVLDDPAGLERIRLKYGLTRPFLYYPAATWPHKNHKMLFEALGILRDRYRFDGQLVLTGIAMKAHEATLAEIARLGLQDTVRVLGYLPYEDLPWLYRLARVMVFPSQFEGFGIPLVEAMACGCPVACSNVTSIPEVVGEAGLLFDPTSAEDIADKAWTLWTDEEVRRRLVGSGLERVRMFDWGETARRTIDVYRKAVAG